MLIYIWQISTAQNELYIKQNFKQVYLIHSSTNHLFTEHLLTIIHGTRVTEMNAKKSVPKKPIAS